MHDGISWKVLSSVGYIHAYAPNWWKHKTMRPSVNGKMGTKLSRSQITSGMHSVTLQSVTIRWKAVKWHQVINMTKRWSTLFAGDLLVQVILQIYTLQILEFQGSTQMRIMDNHSCPLPVAESRIVHHRLNLGKGVMVWLGTHRFDTNEHLINGINSWLDSSILQW